MAIVLPVGEEGPTEFRYVSAILTHDMMTLNSDQLPVPVMTIDWQDDVRMGLGHGSFGQELWLGLFFVVGSLELRQASVSSLTLS